MPFAYPGATVRIWTLPAKVNDDTLLSAYVISDPHTDAVEALELELLYINQLHFDLVQKGPGPKHDVSLPAALS